MAVDRIQQEWPHITDRLRRRWHKLTAEDVCEPHGSSDALALKLQLRYGVDRREAILQVYEFESGLPRLPALGTGNPRQYAQGATHERGSDPRQVETVARADQDPLG